MTEEGSTIVWQLHTQDVRSKLEIPRQFLLRLHSQLVNNDQPKNQQSNEIPDLKVPEKPNMIGFTFLKEEFEERAKRIVKVKEKKMVPLTVSNSDRNLNLAEDWEKFKRPDFVVSDITNFIEREGHYTTFLNECIQKALKGIMEVEVLQAKSGETIMAGKFSYRLSISGAFIMSMEISSDSKENAKLLGSHKAFSLLFPSMSKLVHNYFENRSKNRQFIAEKEEKKKEKMLIEADIADKKEQLRNEYINEAQKQDQKRTLMSALNTTKRGRSKSPTVSSIVQTPVSELASSKIIENPEVKIAPKPQKTENEDSNMILKDLDLEIEKPKIEQERNRSASPATLSNGRKGEKSPRDAHIKEKPLHPQEDPLKPPYSEIYYCTMNTKIQQSSSLLGEFLSIFKGKGYFHEISKKSGPKLDDIRKILKEKGKNKFQIVSTTDKGHCRSALIKLLDEESSDDEEEETEETRYSKLVFQYVCKDPAVARETICQAIIEYCL